MANWNEIFDIYESNDVDSLVEIAHHHALRIKQYLMDIGYSSGEASALTHAVAYYFIEHDGFFDGGEGDVFKGVFGTEDKYYKDIRIYRTDGYKQKIELIIRNAPRSVREEIGRFASALYSGRGYISDSERTLIKSFN